MIFASCDTYYTLGKDTKKIQDEHSSIIRPKWDETENWAGVARNWSLGEQEAGVFASCSLSLHLQGYKGCGLETCGELTVFWQVVKIKAHQIFILGAISDFSYPKFTQVSLVPLGVFKVAILQELNRFIQVP